ncbi:molybdopterin-dependent oxidoreductase [uncultured Desulfosarcina sp.]|uniref:molybdopterin-containing oxidoreductase family protein n=1 Tax=uncultured Desulfosarcina sp. TaxID=218289 RepID=UPI0029C6AA00|nr:molybdopterin-dependent oxidoreductase [uncultured Desulfosarcina sp.]
MGQWLKTGCVLCAQNCGLEVFVEDGRMVKVRPDKANPRSRGYACRKGLNILYHQYPADRITRPLKRVGDNFEPISWDRAIDEITERLQGLLDKHGPRCLAYLGGSSQGGHMEAGFGLGLLRALGSQYYYSSAGQEFSGAWWVNGRMLGKQYNVAIPDEHDAEMLIAWGWNGMQSHQMPRAPLVLKAFSKDSRRTLVAVDPRRSETAAIADFHLAVRPGTDALLARAMIATILQEGWQNQAYLDEHVDGWDRVRPWFENFDIQGALQVCQIDADQVRDLCRLMTTRRWCLHTDLGIYMGRHSTLNSYLTNILAAVCGVFGVRGGNIVPGMVMPMGFHADERNEKVWRTTATGLPPAAAGAFPPAVIPEEIESGRPDRLRAVIVSACNPLRSWPDTQAFEASFAKLDLLVVNDIVMSETARLAHYVLPCRTFYESWDVTFFPWTYPEVFLQLRRPLVDPPGECLEASQILVRLADRLGLIPEISESLVSAARQDRLSFGAKLMEYGAQVPEAMPRMPFVLAKTLGKEWDSAAKAGLWGLLMTAPKAFRKNAARAGFEPGIDQGDRIFQALLDAPEGIWVGKADEKNPMDGIKTPSGKVEVFIPELEAEVLDLTPEKEARGLEMPAGFPLVLNAGRHMKTNINTMMRNPAWNEGKRACTVAVSPADAADLNLTDGQDVKVTTAAGSAVGELEISEQVRPGMVLVPHGFGLNYEGTVYGVNVNRLTRSSHRDPIGTPLHRFVPCRIEGVAD